MEQYSKYLMWVKNKNNIMINNSLSHSWEEQAFAEDARGAFGGFVWPPRCYSCSFCKKQFRSAQALGGHMNVHRRERAKLKQPINCTQPNSSSLFESSNPSFLLSADYSPSRVSSIPILGQESTNLGCNSDAKSCVCDEVLVVGSVATDLYLGFDGRDDDEVLNCKRRKTVFVSPLIVGSMEKHVDLELRLAR